MRLIQAVIGATVVSTLVACGGGGGNAVPAVSDNNSPQAAPASPSPAPAPSPSPAPAPAPSPAPSPAPAEGGAVWKPEWGAANTAKLRPGSLLNGNCTAGFLFVDPVSQHYYVGTAAHCTNSADGTNTGGMGSRVTIEGIGEVGTVVFDSDVPVPIKEVNDISESSADFSLIQLDPGVNLQANPEVLSFHGPTGYLACMDLQAGDIAGAYGQATPFAEVGQQPRTGAVVRCNPFSNHAEIAIRVLFGDSGGPSLRLSDGKAIGHISAGTAFYTDVIAMDEVFRALTAAGFGSVSIATIDGAYTQP